MFPTRPMMYIVGIHIAMLNVKLNLAVAVLRLNHQLQQELQVQQHESSLEMRLKEKLEKEVKQLHVDMEAKVGDIKALSLQGQRAREEQQRLEQQLKELKVGRGV